MTKPIVSVLIPAYNHAKYVGSTINSIMAQDYANIELIIIDDGSKDNTLEVIESMRKDCEKRFTRFYVETQQNQGTCGTLNKLISLARGEYILLIASDDELLPGAVEHMVTKMNANPEAGLVVGRNTIMDGEGKECFWDKDLNNVYRMEEACYLSFSDFLETRVYATTSPLWGTYEALLNANHIPNGQLIRASVLRKIPKFTKDAPLEDWWLMLQLSKYSTLLSIPNETFRYRWHAANTAKQRKKMEAMEKATLQWEADYVSQLEDKTWYRILRKKQVFEKIPKAILQRKVTSKGRTIIKFLKIPVYISSPKYPKS